MDNELHFVGYRFSAARTLTLCGYCEDLVGNELHFVG